MFLLILLMMRVLFSFLLKLNSHHPFTFTSPLQYALKQNYHVSHNCYRVKNILKLLTFKRLLNKLLLESEWSEVMLIWLFVSFKFIRSSLKFYFLKSFFKWFSLQFQLHHKNCPFFIYRYHYGGTVLLFLRFSKWWPWTHTKIRFFLF